MVICEIMINCLVEASTKYQASTIYQATGGGSKLAGKLLKPRLIPLLPSLISLVKTPAAEWQDLILPPKQSFSQPRGSDGSKAPQLQLVVSGCSWRLHTDRKQCEAPVVSPELHQPKQPQDCKKPQISAQKLSVRVLIVCVG